MDSLILYIQRKIVATFNTESIIGDYCELKDIQVTFQ